MNNSLLGIFLLEGTLYSATTILRKKVVDKLSIRDYFIASFLFGLVLYLPFTIYNWDAFSRKKTMSVVYDNWHILAILTVIGFFNGIVWVHIIKSTDVSFSMPFSFMLSNIMITALAVVFLGEKVNAWRLGGLGLGMISLWLMAK